MIDFARLERHIKRDEGFRAHPYRDTVGVWTIGYGSIRWRGERVDSNTVTVTEREAEHELHAELYGCLIDAQQIIPGFDTLGNVRQEVAVNMVYNLGRRGVLGFRRMREALRRGDVEAAADEMVDSRWYTQVGNRAKRLERAMRSGIWPEDYA